MAEGFIDIKKETRLSDSDVNLIEKNPEGLTKEGIQFNIDSWKTGSRNRYIVKKYTQMLKSCKNLKSSGKTDDGRTILSRDESGKVTWAQVLEV